MRAFAEAYYRADPVAEAFVDEVYLGEIGPKQGRRMLDQALEHGVDSVPDAPATLRALFAEFETDPGTPLRKRLRDEVNYRAQIGYTGFWLVPATYSRHRMPRRFPWVLHPLLQAPFMLMLETLRRVVPPLDDLADRVQRARRERWYRNEVGDVAAEFSPVEEFRR